VFLLNLNTKTLIFATFLIGVRSTFGAIDIAVALLFDQAKRLLVLFKLLLLTFVFFLPL
jgi:hypothetical protein